MARLQHRSRGLWESSSGTPCRRITCSRTTCLLDLNETVFRSEEAWKRRRRAHLFVASVRWFPCQPRGGWRKPGSRGLAQHCFEQALSCPLRGSLFRAVAVLTSPKPQNSGQSRCPGVLAAVFRAQTIAKPVPSRTLPQKTKELSTPVHTATVSCHLMGLSENERGAVSL